MKLNNLNLQRFIFFILIVLISIFTKYYIRKKDKYQTTLIGVVDEIKEIKRNTFMIKFKETSDFNILSTFNKDLKLNKGDSIYKPMFSNTFYIYKLNKFGKYEYSKKEEVF